MALERPQFKLIKRVHGVEIRDYEPYLVATCDVRNVADLNRASNFGFRYLFNYISGQNAESQKISMTVPVQQTPTNEGWQVSFVVPSQFGKTASGGKSAVPLPVSDLVTIEENPGGLVAALVYRGIWGSEKYEAKKQELLDLLSANGNKSGYKPVGTVSSAVYNPPLTPPFLRHNEVLVQVKAANKNGN